jgi:hypothetical protein
MSSGRLILKPDFKQYNSPIPGFLVYFCIIIIIIIIIQQYQS